MIRPRNPRKVQQGRNPSNLTVIPTASSINNKIRHQRPKPVFPTSPVVIDYVPTVVPVKKVVPPNVPFIPPNNPVRNFPKRKRKRNRGGRKRGRNAPAQKSGGNFGWANSNNVDQNVKSENEDNVQNANEKDATNNVGNASENDEKLEIISEKIVDKSENVKDIEVVDLTENEDNATENEENVTENEENVPENEGTAAETHAEDNCFEEVEVASSEGEEKQILIGFRKTKLYYLNYKKNNFFKPKIYELSSQRTVVNCLNIGDSASVDVDVDVVSEAEYEYEADNVDQGDSEDLMGKILEIEEEPGNDLTDQREEELPMEEVIDNSEKVESAPLRNYKTCIEGDGNDFFQGKSVIQDSLDSWKSHLIGLEYLVEVQNKSKDSLENFHCVLCECDLPVHGFPEVYLINHISGREHVLKYLFLFQPSGEFKIG